jgi:hypothetical protein
MTVDILGLGESLQLYDFSDNVRFGVNDISSKVIVDYLVCVDFKKSFTDERLNVIKNTKCYTFYSQLDEWQTHPNFKKIKLADSYPDQIGIDYSQGIPKSIFSPYVAVGLAWQIFEPKKIRLFGVDMVNHNLNDRKDRIIRHWQIMKEFLTKQNCEIEVFGEGILV